MDLHSEHNIIVCCIGFGDFEFICGGREFSPSRLDKTLVSGQHQLRILVYIVIIIITIVVVIIVV